MWKYLKLHETFVRKTLAGEHGDMDWKELREFHDRQTGYLQHERLVHLIVTMFVASFWLLSVIWVGVRPGLPGLALAGVLFVLLVAYLLHYFRMENGVQRLYALANRIDAQLSRAGAVYENSEITVNACTKRMS